MSVLPHRSILALLSILTSVALLHTSITPAAACTCDPITGDEERVSSHMESVELVVEGEIIQYPTPLGFDEPLQLQVERVYQGQSPQIVTLDTDWERANRPGTNRYSTLSGDCRYTITGEPGDRYVLFLSREGDHYRARGCSSFAIGQIGLYHMPNLSAAHETIQEIAGGGWEPFGDPPQAEPTEEHEDLPWPIFLAGSIAVPLAVLIGWSFAAKRASRGH